MRFLQRQKGKKHLIMNFIREPYKWVLYNFQIVFHGISINKDEVVLDGSEGPARIEAEALLASETLAPVAILNKVKLLPHNR